MTTTTGPTAMATDAREIALPAERNISQMAGAISSTGKSVASIMGENPSRTHHVHRLVASAPPGIVVNRNDQAFVARNPASPVSHISNGTTARLVTAKAAPIQPRVRPTDPSRRNQATPTA